MLQPCEHPLQTDAARSISQARALFSGAKRVLGYGIRGGGFLLSEEVAYGESGHEVERALALVRGRQR